MIKQVIAESANHAYIQLCKMFKELDVKEVNGTQQGTIHELPFVSIEIKNRVSAWYPYRSENCPGDTALGNSLYSPHKHVT